MHSIKRATIISILLGTILEWYDFSLLASLAPIIATLFFPASSATLSLLATFAVFATGFIARPLGALLFGHMGDKYGRKNALTLSILLMAVPTTLIGLLPTFETAGISAAILLVGLRLLQGLASSGEYPGAICFLTEIAPQKERGFIGSLSMLGVAGGIFLGSLVNSVLSRYLTIEEVYAWGWRVPFLLGMPIGFIGWFLRYKTQESRIFSAASEKRHTFPLKAMLSLHAAEAAKVILLFSLSTITFYMGFVYITSYLINAHKMILATGLLVNAVSTFTLALLIPVCGYLSDKIKRKQQMFIGASGLFIFSYPIFILLTHGSALSLLCAQLALALMLAIFVGPLAALTAESFSTNTRYTGTSVGVNIGAALFGGTCPLVATYLVAITGSEMTPAFYLIFFAFICMLIIPSLKPRDFH